MKLFPRRRLRPHLTPTEQAYFHCVSHVVDRRFLFAHAEKDTFLQLMRRYERFCKVQVVGYCIMDNHFHILVRVPARPGNRPPLAELMAHVQSTLGQTISKQYQERIDFWQCQHQIGLQREGLQPHQEWPVSALDPILGEGVDLVAKALAELDKVAEDIWRRLYDVSQFLFSLKQQFSHWYNKKVDRVGTLWEERFRATIVQPGPAVLELAAYLDLNPVRAGIVSDAKQYPWCQYSAASKGDELALQAVAWLSTLAGLPVRQTTNLQPGASSGPAGSVPSHSALRNFVQFLIRRGMVAAEGNVAFEYPEPDTATAPISDPIPNASYVDGPVPCFTRGLAVGEPPFLEKLMADHRDQFGPSRSTAARPIRIRLRSSVTYASQHGLVNPVPHQQTLQRRPSLKVLRDIRDREEVEIVQQTLEKSRSTEEKTLAFTKDKDNDVK